MKRLICLICLILTVAMLFCGCDRENGKTEENSDISVDNSETAEVLELIVDGEAKYGIVRPAYLEKGVRRYCSSLISSIKEATGVTMEIVTDDRELESDVVEILIGNTNRTESKQVSETLKNGEFTIKLMGDKIVVAAGDDITLADAIKKFEILCLESASKGKCSINKTLVTDGVFKDRRETFVDVSKELKANVTQLSKHSFSKFPSLSGGNYFLQWVQGGCTDGNYTYTCFVTDYNTKPCKGVIIKTDIKTGEIVKYSQEYELGHAGDATYNPHDNTIAVAPALNWTGVSPGDNVLCIFDAETLEMKEQVTLSSTAYGVAYDVETERYITASHQLTTLYFYDRNFNYIGSREMSSDILTHNFAAQGIHTDGTYIYVCEYFCDESNGGRKIYNNLLVLDIATGTCVARIELDIHVETEYIDFYNGKFYIGCMNGSWTGFNLFEVEIVPQ